MATEQSQNPYVSAFHKTPEQAMHEARAKILWGDSPDDVIKYLQMQSISFDDACIMVDALCTEREKNIRGKGVRKIIIGVLLVMVPLVTWLIFMHIGVIQFHLMAIVSVIGFVGAWFCIKGTLMIMSPNAEIGDIG